MEWIITNTRIDESTVDVAANLSGDFDVFTVDSNVVIDISVEGDKTHDITKDSQRYTESIVVTD